MTYISKIRNAKERRVGSLGFAETLLINYNKKLQTHSSLPIEKLYTHKVKRKQQEEEVDDTVSISYPYGESDSVETTDEQLSLNIE